MKDILRIYDKNATWGDRLLYTIQADLADYNISTKINTIGSGTITLDNGNKWYTNIGVDKWDGTNETVRVWRLHDYAGNLLISGVIDGCEKSGGKCILSVCDMNRLLRRRLIQNIKYTQQGGTYILTEAGSPYGLIPYYFGARAPDGTASAANPYGAITYTTDTASTTYLRDWTFDGTYVNDAVFDVARSSYGANSNGFYGNLYESYSAGAYTMNFKFMEKESAANVATVVWNMLQHDDFSFRNWSQVHHNKVIVKGASDRTNPNPSNLDFWTEQANDAGYQAFWDTGSNITISRATSPTPIAGSSCVKCTATSTASCRTTLQLNDADAYSVTYMPDSNYFVNGEGIQIKSGWNTYLHFEFQPNYSCDPAKYHTQFSLVCELLATGTSTRRVGIMGSVYDSVYNNTDLLANAEKDDWNVYDFCVNPRAPASKIDYINGLKFGIEDDGGTPSGDGCIFYVDNVYFYTTKQATGSAQDGNPTYLREYPHADLGLTSDYDCTNMAQNLLREFNRDSYAGQCTLAGTQRNVSIRAGSNIGLIVPIHNVDITTGQTQAKLLVEGVNYRPNMQTLSFDRSWTEQDAIEAANRNIRLANKIQ